MVKMVSFPPIGKLATKYLRDHGLDFLNVPLEKVSERQDKLMKTKLRRLSGTTIGKKLGLKEPFNIESVPFTNYEVYEPFYNNPTQDAFMYPRGLRQEPDERLQRGPQMVHAPEHRPP